MTPYRPSCIYLDSASREDEPALRLLARFPKVQQVPLEGGRAAKTGDFQRWPQRPDKNSLLLTRKAGGFIKPCPGTNKYLCCGYRILDFAKGCTLDCSYCILQTYLDFPGLVLYTNWEQMWEEVAAELEKNEQRLYRLGTGEFTDSLLLDELTGFSRFIIPRLLQYDNAVLELKTKTANIGNLAGLYHNNRRVIVSWSLNAEAIIAKEEGAAPSLEDRLDAAAACQARGFKLGFHFDPVIYYPEWEQGYLEAISKLFSRIHPDNLAWISLGCLRFPPAMPRYIRRSRPHSRIIWEEFILGEDGKFRYFKGLRIKMYKLILKAIRYHAPQVVVYLCMESPGVWSRVFGNAPENNKELKRMLDGCCWQ